MSDVNTLKGHDEVLDAGAVLKQVWHLLQDPHRLYSSRVIRLEQELGDGVVVGGAQQRRLSHIVAREPVQDSLLLQSECRSLDQLGQLCQHRLLQICMALSRA